MKNKLLKRNTTLIATVLMLAMAVNLATAAQQSGESFAVTDFFIDGSSARVFGMGNAFSGLADDVSAVYWNPAGLYYLRGNEFTSTRSSRSVFDLDTTTQTLSFALPLENSTFGFNLVYSTLGNAIVTGTDSTTGRLVPTDVIDSDEFAFSLSYAVPWRMRDGLSAGATIKSVKQKVAGYSASGIGFDIGFMQKFNENRRVGLVFQNVADMDIGTDVVPFNIRLGASDRFMDEKLLLSAQFDTDYLDDTLFSIGAEYTLAQNFTARLGSNDGEFSAGVGLNYDSFQVDYAFNNDDESGNLSKISVSYLTPSSRRKPKPKLDLPKKKQPAKEKAKPSRSKRPESKRKKDVTDEKTEKPKKKRSAKAKDKKTKNKKSSRDKKKKIVAEEENTGEVKMLKKASEIAAPATIMEKTPEPEFESEFEMEGSPSVSQKPESIENVIPPEEATGTTKMSSDPLMYYQGSIPAYEDNTEHEEGESEFQLDPYGRITSLPTGIPLLGI